MKDQNTLRPLAASQLLWRGLYGTMHAGSHYVVEVDYFDFAERIRLYRDGSLIDTRRSPAKFFLQDGSMVEASLSLYGMKAARIVSSNPESIKALAPLPGTAEARRAAFAFKHPILNRVLSLLSWLVLAIALVTQIPNIINSLGYLVGFSIPAFDLPVALNAALGMAGIAAGLDRGLRMKYNILLDD